MFIANRAVLRCKSRAQKIPNLFQSVLKPNLDIVARRCHVSSSPLQSLTSPADLFPHSVKTPESISIGYNPALMNTDNMVIPTNQRIKENIKKFYNTDDFNWRHSPGNAMKIAFDTLSQSVNPQDVQEFYKMFPSIIMDLKTSDMCQRMPIVGELLEQIIQYISPPYAQFSALHVLASHKHMNSIPETQKSSWEKDKMLEMTCVLAWCSELIHRGYIMHDDMVDGSLMRYGRPTWHIINSEGPLQSINDVLLVERAASDLICSHFENQHVMRAKLSSLLTHVLQSYTYGNAMEQAMDNIFRTSGKLPTLNEYITMTGIQNGSYTIYLPVGSVAILVLRLIFLIVVNLFVVEALPKYSAKYGVDDPSSMKALECVSFATMVLGNLARDYMDVYLEVDDMGNEATDIHNGSMSWLIINAMENGNAQQKRLLQENYGKEVPGSVERVKDVYDQIGIRRRFQEWEAVYYERTTEMIHKLPTTLPRDHIQSILDVARNQFLPYI